MQETKGQLEEHQALPFYKRALKRIRGEYPKRQAREELRRYEIGSWGRIREDLSEAVNESRRISMATGDFAHQRIMGRGALSIWPLSRDPELVTVIDRDPEAINTAQKLWGLINETTLPEFDGVAFELKVGKSISPNDIAQASLLLISDGNRIGSIVIDDLAIETMDEERRDLVEQIAHGCMHASVATSYSYRDTA